MSEVKQKAQLNLGELLQRARHNKRLSREQIARQLHVQPQVLALFEHNDFNKLNIPERFILQHLKDYANLVDLDAEVVIDIYYQGGIINLAPAVTIKTKTVVADVHEKVDRLAKTDDRKTSIQKNISSSAHESEKAITAKKKAKEELGRITAVKSPSVDLTRTPIVPVNKHENKVAISSPRNSVKLSKQPSEKTDTEAGISAICEDVGFEAPSLKSETRKAKPAKKGSRLLRWLFNILLLIVIIGAAFFWYRNQVGQLKVSNTSSTSQQASSKLTPFAKPSAAEQQAAEKMKLEQHIQNNEAMAAQYKILKVPPQSSETGQS